MSLRCGLAKGFGIIGVIESPCLHCHCHPLIIHSDRPDLVEVQHEQLRNTTEEVLDLIRQGSGIGAGLKVLGRDGFRRDRLVCRAAQHKLHIPCVRLCSPVQYSQCTSHSTSQCLGVQLKVHHMVKVQLEISKREKHSANLAL